jgi:hypothetical protein
LSACCARCWMCLQHRLRHDWRSGIRQLNAAFAHHLRADSNFGPCCLAVAMRCNVRSAMRNLTSAGHGWPVCCSDATLDPEGVQSAHWPLLLNNLLSDTLGIGSTHSLLSFKDVIVVVAADVSVCVLSMHGQQTWGPATCTSRCTKQCSCRVVGMQHKRGVEAHTLALRACTHESQ